MKKILLLIIICIACSIQAVHADIKETIDYNEVYNNLYPLDIYFDARVDPLQDAEYLGYMESPYTLFRTSLILYFKKITLDPGYYLLTPRKFSNYDFVMFKENGKITAFIPVYEKVKIDPKVVYKEPPKPKAKLYKRPFIAIGKAFVKVFGRFKRPPKPYRSKIETKITDNGQYFLVWFYQEDYLYKMIFKFKKAVH